MVSSPGSVETSFCSENDNPVSLQTSLISAQVETPTVVIQCGGCKSVIGDTLSLAYINEDLKIVSLDYVTDTVVVAKEKKVSSCGYDESSEYLELSCSHCQAYLGRQHISPQRDGQEFPSILNAFTFQDEQILSYVVGSSRPPNREMERPCSLTPNRKMERPCSLTPNREIERPDSNHVVTEEINSKISKNETDISMVKYTIIGMMERIHQLETLLEKQQKEKQRGVLTAQ